MGRAAPCAACVRFGAAALEIMARAARLAYDDLVTGSPGLGSVAQETLQRVQA